MEPTPKEKDGTEGSAGKGQESDSTGGTSIEENHSKKDPGIVPSATADPFFAAPLDPPVTPPGTRSSSGQFLRSSSPNGTTTDRAPMNSGRNDPIFLP